MSEARRRRRAMEKMLGLKSKSSPLSSKSIEIRKKKKAAGEEVHRQNLERIRNAKKGKKKEEIRKEETSGISLPTTSIDEESITLGTSPYSFLEPSKDETKDK